MRYERKLGDVLAKVYRTMELDTLADEMEVKRVYQGVVGDLISKLTMEVKYSDGVLRVRYASAALRMEISYKKTDLINKINENLGRRVVTRIDLL